MVIRDAEYYDRAGHWGPGSTYDSPVQRERIVAVWEALPPSTTTILDVGCGDGTITNQLAAEYRVTGVDVAPEALKHVTVPTVVASATDLPFEDRSVDAVLATEVLEHFDDHLLAQACTEIDRVARETIVITVPNRERLGWRSVRCPRCRTVFHPDRHYQWFSPRRLRHLFPSFELEMAHETGVMKPRVWRLESFVAGKLKRAEPLWFPKVCPSCGLEGEGTRQPHRPGLPEYIRRTTLGRFLNKRYLTLRGWAILLLRPRQRRNWLVARYRRVR